MATMFNSSEIVQFAIRIEENGEKLYRLMAKKLENDQIKNLFTYLAGEEVKHRQLFQEMVSKLENYEPPESFPGEYFQYLHAYADERIFNKKNEAEIASAEIDSPKEAIEFALARELDSILYYTESKNLVSEAQKKIVDNIIVEERKHYLKLSDLKKKL